LIVCMDGLKGFPDAMESIYSEAEVQPCIVHQIRHSLKSVSYKDKKAFMGDLKKVNRAGTKESRELALEALEDKWGGKFFLNWRSFLKEDLIKELKIGQGIGGILGHRGLLWRRGVRTDVVYLSIWLRKSLVRSCFGLEKNASGVFSSMMRP